MKDIVEALLSQVEAAAELSMIGHMNPTARTAGYLPKIIDEAPGDLFLCSLAKRTGVAMDIISFHPLVLDVARESLNRTEQIKYTKEAITLAAKAVTYQETKKPVIGSLNGKFSFTPML